MSEISDLVLDTFTVQFGAQDALSQEIKLYRPYDVEQILLPDSGNSLAVQAYLNMCNLKFQVESRSNAEYMSPSGRIPFIQCGAFLIPEFDNIVSFVEKKGSGLSQQLDPIMKADMRAYISMVNNVLVNAELYICWVEQKTLNEVTKPRHGSMYPWPLNHFLNWQKRNQVIKRLSVLGWYNKTLEEVYKEVNNCCTALAERLQNKNYFCNEPTELDALVFGHIYAIITSQSHPIIQGIIDMIRQFPKLMEHTSRVNHCFFNCSLNSVDDFEIIESPSKDFLWTCSGSLESLPPLSEDSCVL